MDRYVGDATPCHENKNPVRVEAEIRSGLAHLFGMPPGLLLSFGERALRMCAVTRLPHLKKSSLRAFMEGSLTDGKPPMTVLVQHERRVEMILTVADLIETMLHHTVNSQRNEIRKVVQAKSKAKSESAVQENTDEQDQADTPSTDPRGADDGAGCPALAGECGDSAGGPADAGAPGKQHCDASAPG